MFVAGRRHPRVRRGQTLSGALIALAVAGGFVLAAIVVQPTLLEGAGRQPSTALPASADRRETIEMLAALIASSSEVIAVHQRGERGGSPFVEIVLRLHDERGSDFIRADEIAVISHSRVLQTVMFYGIAGVSKSEDEHEDGLLFSRGEVAAPEFCNRWRLDPHIEPRLIGTRVSDLRVKPLHDQHGIVTSLALGLTWPGDSPDADEEAETLVKVRSRQ